MEFDFLTQLFSQLLSNISLPFILSINITTYFLIKLCESFNGSKVLNKIERKFTTFVVTSCLFVVFYFYKISNLEILTVSALLSPFAYQYFFKALLDKFGIGYNKEDLNLF